MADWDFEADGAEHLIDFGIGVALPTVVWSRAIDAEAPSLDRDGIATFGCNLTASCPLLAGNPNSHYWSGQVRRVDARLPFDPLPVLGPALFDTVGCRECEGAFPHPFYLVPSCPVELCDPDVFIRFAGAELPVTDRLTPRLRTALARDDLVWIRPEEAPERLGDADPRLLGIDRMTGVPGFVVVPSFGLLHAFPPGKLPLPAPPGDPAVSPDPASAPADAVADARHAARLAALASAPAGGLSLLRATTRTLYRIGGLGPGARPPETLSVTDLGTLDSHEVPVRGIQPGRVLSGALHAWETAALVLDQREEGFRDSRLIWLDLDTGRSRLLASFPSFSRVFDRYEIVGLPDGGFALVASSARFDRHTVVTLRLARRGLVVERFASRTGQLVGRPLGSDRGLSLPVRRGRAPWEPVGIPYHLMSASRWRDLVDCF